MMYEPGERSTTVAEQRDIIASSIASFNSVIIVAEIDGELAGYVSAHSGEFNRVRHSAYVVAGARQNYAGQGIGTQLIAALDAWAAANDIRRMELIVRTDNAHAIRLYQRMGYGIEGTTRRSLRVDGEFVDESYMARLIDPPTEDQTFHIPLPIRGYSRCHQVIVGEDEAASIAPVMTAPTLGESPCKSLMISRCARATSAKPAGCC